MNKAWRVFQYEFVTNFKRRGYLIMTFIVPVLLAAGALVIVSGVLNPGGESDESAPSIPGMPDLSEMGKPVGLVDASGLFTPPQPGSGFDEHIKPYADEAAAQAALEAGEIKSYFVIDPKYLEDGTVYRYAEQFDFIGSLLTETDLIEGFLVHQMLDEAGHETGAVEPENVYLRSIDSVNFDLTVVQPESSDAGEAAQPESASRGAGASFLLPYIFGIVMMMGTLFASGYLMTSIATEKENRTIEIVLSSIKPFPLLLGKVLSSGALGLLQLAVYIGVMIALAPRLETQIAAMAGLVIPTHLVVIALLYFVGGFMVMGGIYAVVAAVSERLQDASQFAGIAVLPMVFPLALINQFSEAPNDALPVILSLFPLTSPMAMVMRASLTEIPMTELVISLALLALGAVAAIWFAARLFRVNTLLAGQPPKMKDIWRLVRENT
ncbi:MAG: ABC transporter permease [Anaerolineae bacterium]|nr:ABC transporter permease [Anaerolineae bacterium]